MKKLNRSNVHGAGGSLTPSRQNHVAQSLPSAIKQRLNFVLRLIHGGLRILIA
ncbi:hypothetical protein FHT91_004257 [Rhizobium sp. BK347]|nr:hypothetical protein [Rhizobium sp. BK252]MBB3404342.1 hypothetical protein [Rhizobium sp. BK289]MBB3416585.1 hypothetical protein [Rhizobium sp. BK284]MBB3484463.1 hypothetical protein [Rhizobium sp. BK347]